MLKRIAYIVGYYLYLAGFAFFLAYTVVGAFLG